MLYPIIKCFSQNVTHNHNYSDATYIEVIVNDANFTYWNK